MSETATEESTTVLLRKKGIQERMQCSGRTAARIEETFVTVGQLLDAVESGEELTEIDGIGPATALTIEEWYENRFEREENMGESTVERTGSGSATIHFHQSWEPILEADDD